MRDILFAAFFGLLVGVGCGTALAKETMPITIVQEPTNGSNVQFEQNDQTTTPTATELPATAPSGALVVALIAAGVVAMVVYLVLK